MSRPVASERPVALAVCCAGALDGVLTELVPRFEEQTGCRISVEYERSGVVTARLLQGAIVDVVITTAAGIGELALDRKIVPDSIAAVAGSRIGVAVRAGAVKPDIGSVAAFKATLLDAGSIAYADPETGSPSGNHFVRVLHRLGIASDVASKSRLIGPSEGSVVVVCGAVASGLAELGIQQISEIIAVPGVELLGALPSELQHTTVFSAAAGSGAHDPELALRFIAFITSAASSSSARAKGMEPVA